MQLDVVEGVLHACVINIVADEGKLEQQVACLQQVDPVIGICISGSAAGIALDEIKPPA